MDSEWWKLQRKAKTFPGSRILTRLSKYFPFLQWNDRENLLQNPTAYTNTLKVTKNLNYLARPWVGLGMHYRQCRFHHLWCLNVVLLKPWPVLTNHIIPKEFCFLGDVVGCLQIMGIAINFPIHHVYCMLC